MNRRHFFETAAGAALLAESPRLAAGSSRPGKAPFRVIYSNDTTNIVTCISPFHKAREPFRAKMLEATVDEVTGLVDAHLLQPGLGWIPWWKSKVYPADEHYRWFQERTGLKPDSFGSYMLAGGDLVKVFIDRCRLRGQAPFISLRLNDAHHTENANNTSSKYSVWSSRFVVEHPEYRLGPDLTKWDHRALNWAIPEVRDHKFAFIQELCENYDFDGFELDFMRFYSFFQVDKTSREQRRTIMTEFVSRVRSVLDRTARPGQRRWLCVRVPAYESAHDPIGIDLPAMVAAGVDMVNLSSSYFTVQQTDLPVIRPRIPEAAVYLEMCHSIWNGKRISDKGYDSFLFRRATPEHYFTAAHLAQARGADGVSLFNFVYYREYGDPGRGPFNEPPFEVLKHLDDREWLSRQPQHYILTGGWGNPYAKPWALPRKVNPGETVKFVLDFAPPAAGWKNGGRFRLQLELPPETQPESRWQAKLNGQPLSPAADLSEPYPNPYPAMLGKPEELRAWLVPASLVRNGANEVELTLEKGAGIKPAKIVMLDCALT